MTTVPTTTTTTIAIPSPDTGPALPILFAPANERARTRFLEFFAVHIRNPNTRRSYMRSAAEFSAWCEIRGVTSLATVQPIHVAAWIEELGTTHSVPTVKQRLAGIRALFDWLVIGQVMPTNPASSVRGPRHIVRRGKTPVLDPAEARQLLDAIDVSKPVGLRDRALIGLMVYSFARVGAALSLKVEDLYTQNRRLWVRLHEKGGKRHEVPCHHTLEVYIHDYMDGCSLWEDRKGYVFRTIDRNTKTLSDRPMPQANVWQMIRRRARQAEIETLIGCHTFRATGITAYLKNDGALEKAAQMASHASTRTTQLYDRRADEVSLDEVERILI
ncbi:tyrosine-type recombinase/integrase (plasmid) [Acuticoccus sp. MNP-M23]|uniref:tyrosine-type recombinase/integrase n=1 Tax=Acuticoccus sp. MNP-M23 TaxID=3072793 RepID=UPI0028165C73|nr:tyrosine-type recombinase/integrase [Acuticoccus sp. MNP-M23]WMS45298.1 tyrosine-type recombinase/integrase [Acuticoccus sp. MNP-M23]